MAGNTFGTVFRATTWGESHGPATGVVVDGCPPGLDVSPADIQLMLDRRRPGQSPASTSRKEPDQARILSGVFEGRTTGTPIAIIVENKDAKPGAYDRLAPVFRPGHGDYTYLKKYGLRDHRGGGRASARETVARVAAGAVARVLLESLGVRVFAYTLELGGIKANMLDMQEAASNSFGCPDADAVAAMAARVKEVREKGDSIGGIVEVRAEGVPPGLGEPVFDKLDAEIAKALMSIGAVKGVEIGDGFASARALGSQNNDPMAGRGFLKNSAGGILAGISTGQPLVARVAVKPIPSIAITQQTLDINGNPTELSVGGRHDVAAIPRINVVCEAMMCLVLADLFLRQKAVRAGAENL